MADIDKSRYYLDYAGLSEYDKLIKQFIKNGIAAEDIKVQANTDAINVLNGPATQEGSVAKQVADAISGLIDGAPEAFNTLNEIAQWIASDETGTAALINRVATNEQNITKEISDRTSANDSLKAYVDSEDNRVYNATTGISIVNINSLFNQKVNIADGQSVSEAIANILNDGKELILPKNSVVDDNLIITNDIVIDANGTIFTGTVTIDKDADVVIKNAIFTHPVNIQ